MFELTEKTDLMRKLMFEIAEYNYTFCFCTDGVRTRDTFSSDFPIAYQKIMNGCSEISKDDMQKATTKTNADDYFERVPFAKRRFYHNEIPSVCARNIGYKVDQCVYQDDTSCNHACWNNPVSY